MSHFQTDLRCYRVPPSPQVLSTLYMNYLRDGKPVGLSFRQYLHAIGFTDPSVDIDGMDDGVVAVPGVEGGPSLVSVPRIPITGTLNIIVLLADFRDQRGTRPRQEFVDLFFSDSIFPTGSVRDYFAEVSCGKVNIVGTVSNWLRLPRKYSYYVNGESGTGDGSYPNSAQKMAEDAVRAAMAAGIDFPPELDALNNGTITSLIIIHSGPGAEVLAPSIARNHIWSHKWTLPRPVQIRSNLFATSYLTVPEDCRMGVCAHELGHLAFQWEDFYDPNGYDDGVNWSGSGKWDLMAAGSWNGGGDRPAHPAALHKSQHGWISIETVEQSKVGVRVKPYSKSNGSALRILSKSYKPTQMLLLENRTRAGFDDRLPGEGLLVWRVDIERPMTAPTAPALQLVQADGQGHLEQPPSFGSDVNQGDSGDPFPGSTMQTLLTDVGTVSTSFYDKRSGITLSNIRIDASTGDIVLDVAIKPVGAAGVAADLPIVGIHVGPGHDEITTEALPEAMALKNGLERTLGQRIVTASELEPLVKAVTPTLLDLERKAMAGLNLNYDGARVAETGRKPARRKAAKPKGRGIKDGSAAALAAIAAEKERTGFDSWMWKLYKSTFGVAWDARGKFHGKFTIETKGTLNYFYLPDPADPFRYVRNNGEVIQPGVMMTDGGTVPRVAWLVPDLDPWTYLKAYALHDWQFLNHHCHPELSTSFENANLTLAEGIFTLMMDGEVDSDWRKVEAVYQAVSSFVGRGVWERPWIPAECMMALPNN